jgi:hypothetical protein
LSRYVEYSNNSLCVPYKNVLTKHSYTIVFSVIFMLHILIN